jgi:pimeloyl-ACP methyl ester carboxylesterase
MNRTRLLLVLAASLGILIAGAGLACADAPPPWFVDESKLPFDALPGTTTTRLWGVHNGAGFRIEVPSNWNGDLVLYAHGFRGSAPEALELTVSNPRIREYLITHGFAWAASSYSKNGYDVKQGVKDTHALGTRFRGLFGNPRRTYITGHSMGGHVTGVAIEQYPQVYAGALPMCGVMGDSELFDFFLDFGVVAQALAGVPAEFPVPDDFMTNVVPVVKAALGPAFPFALNAQGQALAAVTQNLTGGSRPLFDLAFLFWNGLVPGDFLFGLHASGTGTLGVAPGNVSGNVDTVYQFDSDPTLTPAERVLNEVVLRVAEDPQGRHPNGLADIPPVLGNIRIPVVSIHTIGDLFVPFSMEQIYARRVDAHGGSDLLVARAIRDVRHCGFLVQEEAAAFADLVKWVETGAKPAGDDILDPTVVAHPNFGCTFTLAPRPVPFGAPCLP